MFKRNARHWADPEVGIFLLRSYLGVALIVRGVAFLRDPGGLLALVDDEEWLVPFVGAHIVALTHVIGGLLLALGLATRLAAAAQVPVVVGAIVLVHWPDAGWLQGGDGLALAALVLVLLMLFAVFFGSGPLSVDALLERPRPSADASLDLAVDPGPPAAQSPPAPALPAVATLPVVPDRVQVGGGFDLSRDVWVTLVLGVLSVSACILLLVEGHVLWALGAMLAWLVGFTVWRVGTHVAS